MADTKAIWQLMMERCYNPEFAGYENYGGRGISVMKRWHKFERFLMDMGERPDSLTIERLDSNGNYCRKNCRWMSMTDNSNNKRTCVFVECFGIVFTISEWCRMFDPQQWNVYQRVRLGWPIGEAIATPLGSKQRISLPARIVEYGDWKLMQFGRELWRAHTSINPRNPRKVIANFWREIDPHIEASDALRDGYIPESENPEFCEA